MLVKIMYRYQKYYAIEFKINKQLDKKEKVYLQSPLFKMESENSGIILPSKKNITYFDVNEQNKHLLLFGKKLIPLQKYQETVTNAETVYIWNELMQKFGKNLKTYPIENNTINPI